jgi:glycosyltransferase involved in cell wall biosynthesis
MKILHVIHQFVPESRGGVESYVVDLTRAQMAAGLEVCMLSGSKVSRENPTLEQLDVDGLEVHRLHRSDAFFDHYATTWNPIIEGMVEDLFKRLQPDLVHVHHWIRVGPNIVEIADRLGIPAVVTLHDVYTSCPRVFRVRPGETACMRPLSVESCADCVPRFGCEPPDEMAESLSLYKDQFQAELSMARTVLVGIGATADLICEMTGFPRGKMEVLPLGYRRRFQGRPRPSPRPPEGESFRFAYWGSIGHHKGVRVLLGAFQKLVAAQPQRPAVLHVLGEIAPPELKKELEEMARGLPIQFHGAFDQDQLLEVAPHVGIFPSTCIETFGLVLDECFEMGLPCIVSDKGALPIRARGAGLVVPAGDVAALANAMDRVLSDLQSMESFRIPELPPTPEQHEKLLRSIYHGAVASPRPAGVEPIPRLRRLALLNMQRENAHGLVSPTGPH